MNEHQHPLKKITVQQKDWDSTFQLMAWWKKEQVRQANIMVVGAGALGNEVLKNLALMGVGNILIVDFDRVEYTNLSRSILFRELDSEFNRPKSEVVAERVREINPNVRAMHLNGDISIDVGLGVFRRMDAIIGCLDNRLARLYINRYSFWMGKTWIDGAIENLAGQLNVYRPGVACYESGLNASDLKNIKDRIGCPDIARRNAAVGRVPTTPLSSSIIAAMQVQEALKVLHGYDKQLLLGKTFYYEGMNNEVFTFDNTPPNDDVDSSFAYDPIIEAENLTASSRVKDVLLWARGYFGEDTPLLRLHHRLVLEIIPSLQNVRIPVVKAFPQLSDQFISQYLSDPDERIFIGAETSEILLCPPNIEGMKSDLIGYKDSEGNWKSLENQELTLSEMGIPSLHVIRIFANGETHFVELTGDAGFLVFE